MANQYTKLFIDNQPIDLNRSEDLPLNITRWVNSVSGSTQGDYSRASIVVPATKNNISILNRSRSFRSFRIEIDGVPDMNGTAQVKKIKIRSQGYGDVEENYEINLISSNSSWMTLLGETMLSDLTDLIVTFDDASVIAGMISQPLTLDYCFAPIKWAEWENFTGTPPDILYQPSYFEMTPSLFIKPFIIAAFNKIGWTVKSDFFDTDLGMKLAMDTPIPEKLNTAYNDKYLTTEVSISAPIVIPDESVIKVLYDSIDIAAPSNPTAYDPLTGFYTCPLSGYFELTMEFSFPLLPVPTGSFSFLVGLAKNNISLQPQITLGFGLFNGQPYPAGQTLTISTVIFANAGDTISTTLFWSATPDQTLTIDSARMSIVGEAVFQHPMPIDFKFLLKNYKFLDMFSALKKMFNLCMESNDSLRTIRIEPKDTYLSTDRVASTSILKEGFYKTSEVKDYTFLIDYDKKVEIRHPIIEGVYDFKYKSDEDETINFIESEEDVKIYESRFAMSSGSEQRKTKQIEVPFFAKTIHVFDVLARYPDTVRVPQYMLIYPQNYILDPTASTRDVDKTIRIFYFAGQRAGFDNQDGLMEFFENPGVPALVPMAFMVNYNDDSGLDPNLGFDNQVINGIKSRGLLQNYYLQNLARDDKGQLFKAYTRFSTTDNFNLSFRIKGLIKSQRYVVQKIEGFNPLKDQPTLFNFYLDVFPSQDDVNRIVDSPVRGVVNLQAT